MYPCKHRVAKGNAARKEKVSFNHKILQIGLLQDLRSKYMFCTV